VVPIPTPVGGAFPVGNGTFSMENGVFDVFPVVLAFAGGSLSTYNATL